MEIYDDEFFSNFQINFSEEKIPSFIMVGMIDKDQ